jgi:hypothetical protein
MSSPNGNGSRRKANRDEFEAATGGIYFTKDFNTALEAIMADELASNGQRVLSWIKRRAWGNYCLYCTKDDGTPAIQADCARELNLNKGAVSAIVKYLEDRDYVRPEGKLLYPVIAPNPGGKPQKVTSAITFQSFLENWKVANATTFHELAVADAIAKRIRLVIHGEYRRFRRSQQTAAPPLNETVQTPEDYKEEETNGRTSSVVAAPPAKAPRNVRPSVQPSSAMKVKVKTFLTPDADKRFGLFTPLEDPDLTKIAAPLTDDATFESFKAQIRKQKPKPGFWIYFETIAKACAAGRAQSATSLPPADKPAMPDGFAEACQQRIGDGSLESYRKTTGNPSAQTEDLIAAYDALWAEFGIAPAKAVGGAS